MKKKNYFSGFSARIAFAIIALTGALLTGCYKDDGLDVNSQVGEVVLPDATYTINGSVIDGKTGAAVTGATVTVSPSTNFTLTGNSFTATVQPGNVTITVSATDYATVTKVVTINAIEAGQAAVYSQIIPMVSTIVEPVSRIVDFDVTVDAFLADDNTPFTACTAALYDATGTTAVSMTGVSAGIYKLVVTPTDLTLYETYTSIITLDEVVVPADFEGNLKRNFAVDINKVSQRVAESTYTCYFINYNGNGAFNVTSAQLTVEGVVEVSAAMASTISYTLPTADATDKEIAVVYTYKNMAGVVKTGRAVFSEDETTLSVVINPSKTASAVWQTSVKKGIVKAGTTSYEDTEIIVQSNTNATLNGVALTQPISLERDYVAEETDPSTLIAFEGKPDGTVFSTPIEILFNDNWGAQLGKLDMSYLDGSTWTVDTDGGSITTGTGTYTMNVKHFSTFRAAVPMTDAVAKSEETQSTTFTVNKANENDQQITVKVQFTAEAGTEYNTTIADAVKAAGFTNANAAAVVSEMIENYLLSLQISNTGITTSTEVKDVTVGANTLFVSYDRVYTYEVNVFTFTVNSKVISLTTKTASKTELTNIVTEDISHGHGHGHGNGNLAGGGIINAE